jgi:protease I
LDLKSIKGKNGLIITPDATIESLKASELYALILPGGWAPDKLRRYDAVKKIAKEMNDAGKIIGIICHGGSIAISAGIIKKGQRVTGSTGIKDDLVNAGAVWADEPAFREGNQVWGRVVADIPDFCRELVKALK